MPSKRREKKEEKISYPFLTHLVGIFILSIISYYILSSLLIKPDITMLFITLDPTRYISSLDFSTIKYNTIQTIQGIIFAFAMWSSGLILARLKLTPSNDFYMLYPYGLILNSAIVLTTGFFGFISKTFYLFLITFEICIGIVIIILMKSHTINFHEIKTDIKNNIITSFLILLIISVNFIVSLSPEIFYDSLNYHLGAPNWWLLEGKIKDMEFNTHYKIPLNHSIIYLISLVSFGEQNPVVVNFITSVFCIILLVFGFKSYIPSKTSFAGALLFYSIFHVSISSQSASGDIIPTYMTILSIKMILDYMENKENKTLLWAGLFGGFAFGSKYNIAYTLLPFTIIMLYKIYTLSYSIKKTLNKALVFSLSFSIFSLPWMIKNTIKYSDPIYPFLQKYIIKDLADIERITKLISEIKQNDNFSLYSFLKLPFDISTSRIINTEYFTPAFLMILPVAVLNRKKNKFIRYLWFSGTVSYILWATNTNYIRFLMPSFFIFSFLTAFYVFDAFDGFLKSFLKLIFTLAVSINIIYLLNYFEIEKRYEPVLGIISRDEFLSTQRVRYPKPSYAMYKYINENLPQNSLILVYGDSRTYYLRRRNISNSVFNRSLLLEVVKNSKDSYEIYQNLKKSGITHIMFNLIEAIRTKGYGIFYLDNKEFERFDDFYRKHLKKIHDIERKEFEKISEKIILWELVENVDNKEFNYFSLLMDKKT